MQQALEALQEINKLSVGDNAICLPAEIDTAMDALRDRLAQPEHDPVAWYDKHGNLTHHPFKGVIPLYRAPYPWVGLTDEEVQEIMEKTVASCTELDDITGDTARFTWRNIEAKLKEKNGG